MANANNITELLTAGMHAEHLRQKAIASNMANMQTPGYRRIDVKFRELLANAMDSNGNIDLKAVKAEIYQPMNTPVDSKGNDVHLETEIGQMVKNSLRYSAYTKLLNKKYGQMAMAAQVK